jgi:hypothetical protein
VPERLDRIEVTAGRDPGQVAISWAARDELLSRLDRLGEQAESTVDAFRAVGASRPVELELPEKELVSGAIDTWLYEVGGGKLPPGIFELRDALIDDLRDAGREP